MTKRMVWICWKDIQNPEAGGAELVHQEISKRLVANGWDVVHLVPGFRGCAPEVVVDGIRIVRVGHGILSFYRLPFYFRRHMQGATTFLVDAFIGLGSFSCLLMKPERTALVVYHVEGIKWFYQSRFSGVPRWVMPFFQATGYFIEKIQLMLLALLFRGRVVTISKSTADDLVRHGFRRAQIAMLRVAISGEPLESLAASKPKEPYFTVMGINMRKGKRLDHVVKAFEKFVSLHPDAHLWLAGGGGTEDDLKDYVGCRGVRNVTFWGRVTDEQRDELLQRCHVLCVPSIREGWGLVVIEANAMGTPVIGYDVPGLRDALAFDNGWLSEPTAEGLAEKMEEAYQLWVGRRSEYDRLRGRCLESACGFSFEKTYEDFKACCGL